MFGATPLDCQVCKYDSTANSTNCKFILGKEGFHPVGHYNGSTIEKPDYSHFWVKKYCTSTSVHKFTVYFPYALILVPL